MSFPINSVSKNRARCSYGGTLVSFFSANSYRCAIGRLYESAHVVGGFGPTWVWLPILRPCRRQSVRKQRTEIGAFALTGVRGCVFRSSGNQVIERGRKRMSRRLRSPFWDFGNQAEHSSPGVQYGRRDGNRWWEGPAKSRDVPRQLEVVLQSPERGPERQGAGCGVAPVCIIHRSMVDAQPCSFSSESHNGRRDRSGEGSSLETSSPSRGCQMNSV